MAEDDFLTVKFPELTLFNQALRDGVARVSGECDKITSYEELHRFSIENNDLFWSTLAKSRLDWYQLFDKCTTGSFADSELKLKWFIDGKLNVSGKSSLFFLSYFIYSINLLS